MSLYSMLPEAKSYLKKGGFSEQAAGFTMMGCFLGGFVGIQFISRIFHQLLPSHVVDCDHSHDDVDAHEHAHTNGHAHANGHHSHIHPAPAKDLDHPHSTANGEVAVNGRATESSPLLSGDTGNGHTHVAKRPDTSAASDTFAQTRTPRSGRSRAATTERRPSMLQIKKRVESFVKDSKANCDESGPCFGYSDPCGQECFKHMRSRSSFSIPRPPTFLRTTTGSYHPVVIETVLEDDDDAETGTTVSPRLRISRAHSRDSVPTEAGQEMNDCDSIYSEDLEAQHHHHVPQNAFLAIGLQTSIAIALHKFPEGFITYATNHANPTLGFNVFLALFVHNISEGFAMALPLYMALNSRWKAMLWSSLLGGLSQPLGALIAVIWFKVAKHTHTTPSLVAYGCLFAATAGIMASVALQLFVESLSLNHNRNLSLVFAFIGMALLGLSSAFTSEH
jgi:ZIP family zinc transporter